MRLSATDLAHEVVPIDQLQPFPGNARLHDDALLDESIGEHGVYRTVVVSSDGYVIAGNGTWQRAKEAGEELIAVTRLPLPHDDPQAIKINVVDNRANDKASNDADLLASLLTSLPDLAGTGYDQADLAELITKGGPYGGLTDPDDVPEPPTEAITKPGDLWLLGDHRLLCGDSTVVTDVDRLMAGQKADMVWTDPPYGVNVTGGTHDPRDRANYGKGPTIRNDALTEDQTESLWREAAGAAATACRAGAAWYSAAPPGPLHLRFARVLSELEILRQMLVWVKSNFVFGRSDYHYRHEPIMYGWVPGAAHYFVEDRTQDTVLEFDRPERDLRHPTMKPVELVQRCIGNSSRPRDVVLDPFGGSGTTLLAAEISGRKARLMEIDPGYCDVICRRFQEFTGTTPILESTGEAWDFTSEPPARAA